MATITTHRVRTFGIYHLAFALLLGVVVGALLILSVFFGARAQADSGYIETSAHGVVRSSTLPHCTSEDPRLVEAPCTWNVGDQVDGNGIGLAFVVLEDGTVDYVWATSPVSRGWHWVRLGHDAPIISDCVVKQGKAFERCPDGHHDLGH